MLANLAVLPVITLVRNYNCLIFHHDYDRSAFAVVETLAQQAPRGARLFMNIPADSLYMFNDIRRLLALLHSRNDFEQFNYNAPDCPPPRPGDYLLLFVREPPGRSPEYALDASFHHATLRRDVDRLQLIRRIRYDRWLLNSCPDAFVFNTVAASGIKLPSYLGMHTGQRRGLLQRERSLIEWTVYQFRH